MERGTRDPLEHLDSCAVGDANGQAGVVLRARPRHHALRELPLEHEDRAIEPLTEELERDRRRDLIWEVRHHHVELRPFDFEGVALEDLDSVSVAVKRCREASVGVARDSTEALRARALVDSLRAGAPDSLRALFAADSAAHAGPLRLSGGGRRR